MSAYNVIEISPHERVLLADVQPRRLDATTAAELEDEVSRAVLERPGVPVVLDLSKVKFAPSVALGTFVNLFRGLKMANRKAFLIGLNHQIRGALAVTRLDALIEVRQTLDEVLAEV